VAATANAEAGLGFGASGGRKIYTAVWLALLVFQGAYLCFLGEKLNYLGNSHAEADTLRAAEAYVAKGLGAHHGLPRMLYGNRFPQDGTVKDHLDSQGQVVEKFRHGFPLEMADRNQWVTTHCPPGADLINGLQARTFGLEPIWRLRLFPILVGLTGLAFFFQTVARVWGIERGALIALAVAALPMVSLWLPTLHYEGYAFALILLQTSVLLRALWGLSRPGLWLAVALFLLGMAQGWLSWDHFFVVSLLAVPWWLLRRAEGINPPLKWLFWMTALPAAGFALAHLLHLCLIAADLHSWRAAIGELHQTAAERGGIGGGKSWFGYMASAIYLYIRWCFKPTNLMFGPFFAMLLILAAPCAVFSALKASVTPRNSSRRWQVALAWPGTRSALPPLIGALLVCSLWLVAMPQHVFGHSPLTDRHLTTLYLCMAVVVARSLQVRVGKLGAGSEL
jgi:hypothetical protein